MTGSARLLVASASALLALAAPGAREASCGTSASGGLSIEASLDTDQIAPGEAATLTVVVRSVGINLPDVELPTLPGAIVQRAGTAQNFSMVNGRVERSSTTLYRLIGRSEGTVRVPPLEVSFGRDVARSDPLTLTITRPGAFRSPPGATLEPRVPGGAPSGAPELFVKAIVDRPRVYWNQQLILRLRLYSRVEIVGDVEWKAPSASGFWTEGLGPARNGTVRLNGADYAVTEILTALFPTRTGTLTIGPAEIRCRVARVIQAPDPWSALGIPDVVPQDVVLRSNPVAVTVDPLPPGAPPGFQGGVGKFDLALRVDRREGRVGEPVTVHAVIRGEGNVSTVRDPQIRSATSARQYVAGSATRIDRSRDRISGERALDVAFVPDRAGELDILPVRFTWFDPEAGRYRTQSSDTVRVQIGPGNVAESPGARPGGRGMALVEPRRSRGPAGTVSMEPPAWNGAVVAFSFLAYASALGAGKLRARRARDPRYVRRRALERLIERETTRAEGLAAGGQPARAAAIAQEALRAAMGLRFDADLAGLARAEAFQAAKARGASDQEIAFLGLLFDELERIAFAPSEFRGAEARDAIRSVSDRIERYRKEMS